MGMYCLVSLDNERDGYVAPYTMKMSGLVAQATISCAHRASRQFRFVDLDYSWGKPLLSGGCLGLTRDNVKRVVAQMHEQLAWNFVSPPDGMQELYGLQKDVNDLVALHEWLEHSKDGDELWFG